MPRKKRSDRTHVIYMLTAPNGDRYIGVTFSRGRAYQRSAKIRWEAHCRNALKYNHDTLIANSIREFGADSFERVVVDVVRGKQNAHDRERSLIAFMKPELNMEGLGRKINSVKVAA